MTPPNRYHRQQLLPFIGEEGQRKLSASAVTIIGCGALGTVMAEQLARAGVGQLTLIDRDIVELSNLQRQVLFDESDVAESLPKSVAAAQRLAKINSSISITPLVADVTSANIEELALAAKRPHVLLDGTDNVETRYLLNDLSIKHNIPWIYCAAVGAEARLAFIGPTKTPCLRCIFPSPPSASDLPTCDRNGVLGPVTSAIASLAAAQAIKFLAGQPDAIDRSLLTLDLWSNRIKQIDLSEARNPTCPCCASKRFDFLSALPAGDSTTLCGRNAIQITPPRGRGGRHAIDLASLAQRLTPLGQIQQTRFLLRCQLHDPADIALTVFADGRTLIHGTSDPARARSLYARFIGS